MAPVYVLGAGFSRAISERMPTMAELSAAVKAELVGYDIPGRDNPVSANFEQWLSYLIENPPWLSPADQAHNRAGFMRVSEALHTILSRLQGATVESQEECPEWLQRLVVFWQLNSMLATELPLESAITPLNRDTKILERITDVFDIEHYPRTVNDSYIGENPIAAWVEANAT